eukprot:CAMPEP_0170111958 /NCGR_PEP_ID=MMETSP0020_2-20130122/8809_1 /TAXON_ID=98059 /ORGANISM="Dinobryon sp., Strain UTEXLB2267" /LENGTH=299 /DNA_ID=CAMNT_0010337635 /DNA_START=812 /DNA_END=1711 /DNA_ORIENTATION=-
MAFNSAAGYHSIKEMDKPEDYPSEEMLRKFNKAQFIRNGFYIGTIFDKEKRTTIDKLVMLIEKEKSLLAFRNATKIFNTMIENDEEYLTISTLDDSSTFDRGRNQLKVDDCKDIELKELSEQVGKLFLDQVCLDLNINEDKKGEIFLSILETEASKGDDHVPHQLIHTDVDPDNPSLGQSNMWIGILGLDDTSYHLRVLRYSHVQSKRVQVKRSHKKKSKPRESTENITVIKYRKYQYVVEHPQLGHGGFGSRLSNNNRGLRMHGFHGFPKEAQETTYLINWSLFNQIDHLKTIRNKKE